MLVLLGGIDWSRQDVAAMPALGRKARALLALTAANGRRGIARDQLIGLLWADLEAGAGAAALRQCLHHLRRALGDLASVIDARRDRIGLHAAQVDVFAFEALAARDDAESQSAAAQLYRGDFCEGLETLEDVVAREIESERVRLRQLAHRVAARIAASADDKTTIDLGIGVGLARRLLARDPLHEAGLRTLMELLDRGGMRAEALGAYEGFRETLRRELAIEPSVETVGLAQRLRAAGAVKPASSPTLAPVDIERDEGRTHQPLPLVAGVLMFPDEATPTAVDHLLYAWGLLRRMSAENNRLAREAAETAQRIDRNYVSAFELQGWTHWFDWLLGWSHTPDHSWYRAVELAERVLALEGDKAPSHLLRAMLHVWERRHDDALEHALIATRIAPDFAHAQFHLANALLYSGRHSEALDHYRRARTLDANDTGLFLNGEAVALFMLGELPEARQVVERAITRNPTSPLARISAVAIYSDLGSFELARAEARTLAEICPKWRYGAHRLERDRDRFPAAWARIGLALEPERGLPPGAKVVSISAKGRQGSGSGD